MSDGDKYPGDDRAVALGQAMLIDGSSSFGQLAPYYVVFGFLLAVVVVVAVCCCCPLCGCRTASRWNFYERACLWLRQAATKCRCPWPGMPCRCRRSRQTDRAGAGSGGMPADDAGPPSYLEATAVGHFVGSPTSPHVVTTAQPAAAHHVVIVGLSPRGSGSNGGAVARTPPPSIRPLHLLPIRGSRSTAAEQSDAASAAAPIAASEATDHSCRLAFESDSPSSSFGNSVGVATSLLPSYEEAVKMTK